MWLLDELVPSVSRVTPSSDRGSVSVISLHKSFTAREQQDHCQIEGVGEVRTSWIGQKGVRRENSGEESK